MKITSIKRNGEKLSDEGMKEVFFKLAHTIEFAGWHVHIARINSSRIDITGPSHGRGPQRTVHNYRVSRLTIGNCKKGYKRCKTPTWNQYIELNNTVNDILDFFKISATVKARDFNIRFGVRRINEWRSQDNVVRYVYSNTMWDHWGEVLITDSIEEAERAVSPTRVIKSLGKVGLK